MAESKDTHVRLPDIDPPTMRICLEFFYTDFVQTSRRSNVFLAMKVVKAAMFFFLRCLQSLALHYINGTTSYAKKDVEWCEGLIPSYNLGIQLYPAHISEDQDQNTSSCCRMREFLNRFCTYAKSKIAGCSSEQLFSGCKHERVFYKSISESALAHFIESQDARDPLSHYFSFLHVVRWSASRLVLADPSIDEGELEEVLNKCFPRSSNLMGSMLSSSSDIQSDDAKVSRFMKLICDELAQCLRKIPLNFAKIPTHILCRFIEPLDVLPSSTLLNAYRHQAFDRRDLLWDQLGHGISYKIDHQDATVIYCSVKNPKGFALCSTCLDTNSDAFFDWEVVILRPCENLRVGFCICKSSFKASECNAQVLGLKPGTWALGVDGSLHHTKFSSETESIAYVDAFHDKKVSIQVHLNMVNGSCSFSIDGKHAGVAWKNLPRYGYTIYPAVSLDQDGRARIRMVHQSWINRPSKRLCVADSEVTSQASSDDY